MDEAGARKLGAAARDLFRRTGRATLATLDAAGGPYASLVLAADDAEGSPILLLSKLAEHVKNLARDPRASLLIDGTLGLADPLTGPRVTLVGTCARNPDPALKARFLARHPAAATYAGFGDFAVWRMNVERAHLIEGFGRIAWIEGRDFLGERG